MTTVKIREKIYDCISQADERILKAVYAMLKEYEKIPAAESMLSEKQYEEIEKRWKNHKSGKSKGYTIQEVRQHVSSRLRK